MVQTDLAEFIAAHPHQADELAGALKMLARLQHDLAHLDAAHPEILRRVSHDISLMRHQQFTRLTPATAAKVQQLVEQIAAMLYQPNTNLTDANAHSNPIAARSVNVESVKKTAAEMTAMIQKDVAAFNTTEGHKFYETALRIQLAHLNTTDLDPQTVLMINANVAMMLRQDLTKLSPATAAKVREMANEMVRMQEESFQQEGIHLPGCQQQGKPTLSNSTHFNSVNVSTL
jgi:hypothetical protein